MPHPMLKLSLCSLAVLVTLGAPSRLHADDTLEHTQAYVGARFGSDVEEYLVDALLPAWANERSVLFVNLRGSFLESAEQEANLGMVYRSLSDSRESIFGANLYYDHRWTEQDQTFGQVGGGLEYLSTCFDARLNVYVPLDDAAMLSESASTEVTRQGNQIITTRSTRRVYEEPLQGYDAEIGVWLPLLDGRVPTGLFVGYYDFSSDFAEDISGMKARLEVRAHRNIILDAEWFEDEQLNRSEYMVGLRIAFTFSRENPPGAVTPRLYDLVHRDFRIRTLVTEPIPSGQTVLNETVARTSAPAEEQNTPECFLNDQGDVVCR